MPSERVNEAISAINSDPAITPADPLALRRRYQRRRTKARWLVISGATVLVLGGLVLAARRTAEGPPGVVTGASGSSVTPTQVATTATATSAAITYVWKDVPLVLVDNAPDGHVAEAPPTGVPTDCNGQPQQPTVMLATVSSFTSALSPPTVQEGQQVWAVLCFDVPRSAAGEAAGTLPERAPDGDLIRLYGLDGQWLFTTHTTPGEVRSSPDGATIGTAPPPAPTTTVPLPEGMIVGWLRTGELAVLAPNGEMVRVLAKIPTGYPATGPSGVALTPDRRLAVVSWNVTEDCGGQRVGAVPTDGTGALREWGNGDQPVISPDGTRAAWAAQDTCEDRRLVVHDIASGDEHRIVLGADLESTNETGGAGPWWRDDNTLVYAVRQPDPGPGVRPNALTFDATTAGALGDAGSIGLACIPAESLPTFARSTPAHDGLVLPWYGSNAGDSSVIACTFGEKSTTTLFTTPLPVTTATYDQTGTKLLVLTQGGGVSIAAADGAMTTIAEGPFQSVAW